MWERNSITDQIVRQRDRERWIPKLHNHYHETTLADIIFLLSIATCTCTCRVDTKKLGHNVLINSHFFSWSCTCACNMQLVCQKGGGHAEDYYIHLLQRDRPDRYARSTQRERKRNKGRQYSHCACTDNRQSQSDPQMNRCPYNTVVIMPQAIILL